jgi:hypothetical protein
MDAQIRAQIVRALETMVERYPNLSIGQIIGNAVPGGSAVLFRITDEDLARALNHLFVTYTQFEAAGLMEKGK